MSTKFPAWLAPLVSDLVESAERSLPGTGWGATRKQWVKETAKRLIDLRGVPDAIEDAVIDLVIEVIWAVRFGRGKA